MNRTTLILTPAILALCGCATAPTPEPIIRTVEVLVPVARSCVPETLGAAPTYRVTVGTIIGAADGAERLRLGPAGMLERDARLAELEPVIAACR